MRRLSWLAFSVFLAACQMAAPGESGLRPKPNPIAGAAITTTSLETPVPGDAAAAPADGMVDASVETGIGVPPSAVPEGLAAAEVAPDAAAPKAGADPVTEVVPEAPAEVKSEDQLRCERRGGVFAASGDSDLRTCVKRTRDSGKRCDQEKDCQGRCLARSQTCAPIDPLLGCNEILQDDGAAVTLCIE
jgi:hypothetical protein